jgi:2-keto-3-deoxy-L-rhamnonate aldolase RhmA
MSAAYPRNAVMEGIAAGRRSLGLSIRMGRGMEAVAAAKAAGFDWLFLDLEHGPQSYDQFSQMALGALASGIAPFVRVGGHEPFHANRALTNGALGVFFPHVDTAEQAAACAAAARFGPKGIRGVPAIFPHLGFEKPPLAEAASRMNALTTVIAMIESGEAIANADAIAATPGVDILFIGASDLTVERGKPGAYADPEIRGAFAAVARACAKHGKVAGFGGVGDPAITAELFAAGYRFMLTGNDLDLFMLGAKARVGALRG